MKTFISKILVNQNGQVLVMIAFLFIILIGISGLAIDSSLIIYNKQRIQGAVDLAAMAAIQDTTINYGQVINTAIQFAWENGLSASELNISYPYQSNINKLEVSATRVVKLAFLPALGFNSTTVNARAVAEVFWETQTSITDQAFNYAVFSGSTTVDLQIKGTGSVINGSVHGNKKVAFMGSHTINGNLEAVGGTSGDLSGVSGTITKNGQILPIPSINFEQLASKAVQVFNNDVILNDVNINGIWLGNGNITLNGGRITGRGIILARGSISLPSNGIQYGSPATDLLAMYSLGNITLSGTNNTIHGVMYAPGGQIRIAGSYNSFFGALIAKEVYWVTKDMTINGSHDARTPQAFTTALPIYRLAE